MTNDERDMQHRVAAHCNWQRCQHVRQRECILWRTGNARSSLRFRPSNLFRISSFGVSSFPHVLSHDLFLFGARTRFFRADQAAVVKIDQRIVH